jgi:hypothetical protein
VTRYDHDDYCIDIPTRLELAAQLHAQLVEAHDGLRTPLFPQLADMYAEQLWRLWVLAAVAGAPLLDFSNDAYAATSLDRATGEDLDRAARLLGDAEHARMQWQPLGRLDVIA